MEEKRPCTSDVHRPIYFTRTTKAREPILETLIGYPFIVEFPYVLNFKSELNNTN